MDTMKSRLIRHYLPLLILTVLTGIAFHYKNPKWDLITLIADSSGYLGIVLIAVTLIIGSVNILFKRKNPTSTYFRRDIGITAGVITLIHSIDGLFVHLRGSMWKYFFEMNDQGYFIPFDDFRLANYTGLLSALLIVLVLVTSNDYSLWKLKAARWKNIQRLSYVMFLFAIVHVIYYRINNTDLLYDFYLPLVMVVVGFQGIGFWRRNEVLKQRS
jgi:sulfoxide reductase heme-binding subunit YedZ